MSKSTSAKSTAAVAEKMPELSYTLNEAGEVVRTDKDGSLVVAVYHADDKRVEIVPEQAKYRPQVLRFLGSEEKKVDSVILQGDEPDAPKAGIPPCPKPTMAAGDKTPAVVEWYKKYKPAEYRARYGIQGEGTVTKTRWIHNARGEKVKEPYTVEATLAHRKTHLTEKVEAGNGDQGKYADA